MPKLKSSKSRFNKTFTACWTCRARSVRCDQATPHCEQCKQRGLICEGYHIRLVWVDKDTGSYEPMQRRAYACESTWKDYPTLTLKEVGHLIETCDQEPEYCRCRVHHRTAISPFQVFSQTESNPEAAGFSSEHVNESDGDIVASNPSNTDCGEAMLQLTYPTLNIESKEPTNEQKLHLAHLEILLGRMFPTGRLQLPPYQPLIPTATHYENYLFYHYLLISSAMLPVDAKDSTNPWRSVYPLMAAQNTPSGRSLYHAMLAQSAHHLAKLKGEELGQKDEVKAIYCFGMALHELQQALEEPTQDYSSMLAAIMTITSTEHVFRSSSRGWREHFRAATRFVMRHLARRPWKLTHEAWAVTQDFVVSHVVAHTAHKPYTLAVSRSHDEDDSSKDLYDVLCDTAANLSFGYTIGSTARTIKALCRVRRLEAQMAAQAADTTTSANTDDMDSSLVEEAVAILNDLEKHPDDGLDAYLDSAGSIRMPLARARTLASLHINLFRNAVIIYLLSTVLQFPPSTVAQYVMDVLSDAWLFMNKSPHGTMYCSLSLWPLFVAVVDAYLPEAQDIAERILQLAAKTSGTKNRYDVKRLVHKVWAIRRDLAQESKCGPGDIWIDWREVMTQMDMDILLL
ncbi:fungal-specific transcription factor domain-containing protein [Trichoderma sp. SZMC 28014]